MTRSKALPYEGIQSGSERKGQTRALIDCEGDCTSMEWASRELAASTTLCPVGRPDYAQLSNRIYANWAHVRTKAGNAN